MVATVERVRMFRPDADRPVLECRHNLLRMALTAHLSGDDEFVTGIEPELRMPILKIYSTIDELAKMVRGGDEFMLDNIARIVDELMAEGWSETAYNLVLQDYKDIPVTARIFLTDPYYAGKFGEGLYPVNFRDTCWILNPKNRIFELVLTGSTRWGKTTCAVVAMAYRIYLLSLLRDPQEFFGLMRGSSLRYGIFNIFKYKTGEMHQRISSVIDETPYFQMKFPRQGQPGGRELKLPNHVSVVEGSTELHALGETFIGAILDEVNFMKAARGRQRSSVEESLGQAQKLYGAIRGRLRNQFVNSPGSAAPYFMSLLSQRRAQTDFLEEHIKEHGHEDGVCVLARAIWDVQLPGTYAGEKFYVFCGDSTATGRILDMGEVTQYDQANVIEAPVEHRVDAERDVEDFIRNIAGRATVAASALFRVPESIEAAHDPNLRHPFAAEWVVLSTLSDFQLADAVLKDVMFITHANKYHPRLHREAPRIMHIDLASTECSAGIACVHMHDDGGGVPMIYTDFLLRIDPPPREPNAQIDLDKIITFIAFLQHNGFRFSMISFDKYQSRHSMILIQKMGISTEFVSMDESDDPYINLRGYYESGRIKTYSYRTLEIELRHLEHDITVQRVFKPFTGCFSGDTKLALLDGRAVSLRDLASRSSGEKIYVYTVKDGRISVGIGRNPRLTKRRAKTVVVTLDNGEKITCTPDHRFLLRDGSYREAGALSSGQQLMPLYRKSSTNQDHMRGYELYRCPSDGKWHFTHRMVGRWKYGSRYTGNQHGKGLIHHKKGKRNNDPCSLQLTDSKEHGKAHAIDILKKRRNPEFERKRRTAAVQYARSTVGRKCSRQNMLRLNQDPEFCALRDSRASVLGRRTGSANITKYNKSEKHRKVAARIGRTTIYKAIAAQKGLPHWWSVGGRNHMYRHDVTLDRIIAISCRVKTQRALLAELHCTQKVLYRVLQESNYAWSSFKKSTHA